MTTFTYTGTDSRTYPSLGIEASPGTIADFDEAPTDGRWSPAQATPAVTKDGGSNA